MSSFHNALSDTLSPLQEENSSQFDYGSLVGGFGQNGDYYDQHPDELPQSQRPPTEESQRADASFPGGDTQMLQYALGSQNITAEGLIVGPSRSLARRDGSQASLDGLESQAAVLPKKPTVPKRSSPLNPNWQLPANVLNLHETPQRTPSYPSIHSNSNYKPNYEQTPTKRGSGIFSQSESNGGLQEPEYILKSSNDAGVPTSQPSAVAPAASFPTAGPPASSPIFPVETMKSQGTQTLVRATPSPPRAGPQPASDTLPALSRVGDTTTPLSPKSLSSILALAPSAFLTRQGTDIVPETPQSDQDLPQVDQRVPTATPHVTPPVIELQESFVIPEPQAEMRNTSGTSSPRKRRAPDDFEEPPTPTKKTRRVSNGSQKAAGVKPVASRVGSMRGRQGAPSPTKARSPTGKPSARISSPFKAITPPHMAMWDETLDDGFGRKAAKTAAKMKKATEPPVRSLSDFGESQLVPVAVITPGGKTKPIDPPAILAKKGAPKEVAEEARSKKRKGRAATKIAAQAETQLEESESSKVNLKKPSTKSKVSAKDSPSSRRVGKKAAVEALAISQGEGIVETNGKRKVLRSSKSKKDASPDTVPAPAYQLRLDTPTHKGQKRKLNETADDEPSAEVPPKKKRKVLHSETEDEGPAPSKLSRKRKTSPDIADTDAEVPQPPSKKRRNVQVTVDDESSVNLTRNKANAAPLASLPHAQSYAETTTSLRSASQPPNRVFAKWGGNGMYYCGTLQKMGRSEDGVRVCIVKYDDGEVAHVPLNGLRRCEVWVGDVVEVPATKGKLRKSATVTSVGEWEEHRRVRVSVAKGKGKSKAVLEEVDIESRDVSVPAARAEADVSWTRRMLSVEELEAGVPNDERNDSDGDESYRDHAEETTQETSGPAPTTKSRTKAISVTRRTTRTTVDSALVSKSVARSTRRNPKVNEDLYTAAAGSTFNQQTALPFAGDAFLIALSLSDKVIQRASDSKDRERIKKRLQESITRQGGVCVEDWGDLIQLQGTVDERRWVWEKSEDINYSRMQSGWGSTRKRVNIDRVWALADEPNRNTKYFTALALGVPCVGSRWVEDGAKYPWSSYLLPAGHSSVLGQECVQIVNYDYAGCSRTVKQLVDNPGNVRKPFAGKSLLFVSTSDKREKISEADFEEKHALAIIACLMGPARVEVVHDIKHKSLTTSDYDIIIWDVAPPTDFVKAHNKTEVIITDEAWVKECLLTGTLLEA